MKHLSLSFLVLLFICSKISYSQTGYATGYVIDSIGDTINGLIKVPADYMSPLKIKFKVDKESKAIEYTPFDILGFHYQNKEFISREVQLELSPHEYGNMDYNPEYIFLKRYVFLKKLYKGNPGLLEHIMANGKKLYYIQKGEQIELLKYKKYFDENAASATTMMIRNDYKVQLQNAFLGCPYAMQKVEDAKYDKRSFSKLFTYYFECKGVTVENEKEHRRNTDLFAGAIGGYTVTDLSFSGDANNAIAYSTFNNDQSFSGGFFLDLFPFGKTELWSFYNELNYSSYKVTGSSYVNQSFNRTHSHEYTIDYAYLKLHTMARFQYSWNKVGFFVNGGMSNGFAIKSESVDIADYDVFGIEYQEITEAIEDPRLYEFGFLIGGGLRAYNFSAEVRYELSNGMSPSLSYASRVTRLSLLLAYRIRLN